MSDVAIIMGSDSDWPIMEEAAKTLEKFSIKYSAEVLSAHRMPTEMVAFAQKAQSAGYKVIIAGAGGAGVAGHRRRSGGANGRTGRPRGCGAEP